MRRREFIILLGSTAVTWPLAAPGQQGERVRRIGFLSVSPRATVSRLYAGFVQGMHELGYVEGKDFVTEWRSGEGAYERLPDLAAEFVRLKVDVVVTGVAGALPVLQQATSTIPIVAAYSTDPVGNGLVASLAHPGRNITGLVGSSDDTSPKQLELLVTVVPGTSRVGLLGNPNSPTYSAVFNGAQNAGRKVNLSIVPVEARNPEEIKDAFAMLTKERLRAVMVTSDATFFRYRQRIADLALESRLPTIFALRDYAEAGGLMSYGEDLADFFHRAATFVDKIFKGANPGDLPMEQPTLFKLVINRKTADALGLSIPPQLYIFADEVIE